MLRSLGLVLVLAQPSLAAIIQITDEDVGQVVQVMDVSIGHTWAGETIETVGTFDWTHILQLREWNGSAWVSTEEEFSLGIMDLDPAEFAPTIIDELNAASFALDWSAMATMFLEAFTDPLIQARVYETATSIVGASSTMSPNSDGSQVFGSGNEYHIGMILDRFELNVSRWETLKSGGAHFAMRVQAFAEITNAPVNVPEPSTLLLGLFFACWGRYRRSA